MVRTSESVRTLGYSPMLSALDALGSLGIHLNNLESVVFFTHGDEDD